MTAPNVPPREEINGDALLKEVHGASVDTLSFRPRKPTTR
jgi:hypothetical protein